ncbi:MAG TPA: Fic/DOC family N-terminal domain-containing protein [Polyangiaceae bacterium]|jgi:Fic family protein
MDRQRFGPNAPGELISISGGDVAFVPHRLPPAEWTFPNELWPLLAEAKSYVRELEGIGSVIPNPNILLRPMADREAIQSSALEGTFATPQELLLFELEPTEASNEAHKKQDYREVYNYQQALLHGTNNALPLSLRLMRDLHRILLSGVRGRDKTPGEFRKIQVAIGATKRFIPPPPNRLGECLSPLEKYLHQKAKAFDPLVFCFLVHYQFETIHPFVDGNGRVGRLLLAIMLQQRCGLSKPWLYMSEFFEKHRDEYIDGLFSVSTTASWSRWIEFCLQGTLEQAKSTIARCRRLLAVRQQYVQRVAEVGGPVRLSRIIEGIFTSPFVRVAEVATRLGVTYPTAKSDLDRLVQAGVLEQLPDITPKTFYAPEVFAVSYGELGQLDQA